MSFDIDSTLGYGLNRSSLLLRINLEKKFKENGYDITPEEWIILNRLWQKDKRSQNDLAETTIKDKTTVTRLLNRMEKKELIIRENSSKDARINLITLTPKATKLKGKLIPIAKQLLKQATQDINPESLKQTLATLKTIEANLLQLD